MSAAARRDALRLRRRREDPLDRDRVHRRRHLRVLLGRLARARRSRRVHGDLAAVVGAVRDRLGDLPADRAAAVAHDRRPPRAWPAHRSSAAHAAADPGRLRARVPGRRAGPQGPDPGRPVRRLRRAVLGARGRGAGLRRELLRARLAGRAPVVRPLRRARLHGGDDAAAVRGRGADRDRVRADRGRDGHGRGAVRVADRRPVGVLAPAEGDRAQGRRPTRRRSAWPAAGASPSPSCAS